MTAGWTFFRSSGFPFLTVAMLCSAKCQQRAVRFRSQVHVCGCVVWDGQVRQWFVEPLGGSGERDNCVKPGSTYTMSPTPPAGSLFRRAPIPLTEMMYRFRAPELSAQFMMAPLQSCQFPILVPARPQIKSISLDPESGSVGPENIHWETQGHLELATGGTTTARRPPSVKVVMESPNSSSLRRVPSLSVVYPSCLRSSGGIGVGLRHYSASCREFLGLVVGSASRLIDQSPPRPQQLGLTPRADLLRVQVRTHEILAILSYLEGIDLSVGGNGRGSVRCRDVVVEGVWGGGQSLKVAMLQKLGLWNFRRVVGNC